MVFVILKTIYFLANETILKGLLREYREEEEVIAMDKIIQLVEDTVQKLKMNPNEMEIYHLYLENERDRTSLEQYISEIAELKRVG